MKIRDDVLVTDDDMGTSGTKIYDLNYADPISRLELQFNATNGATYNKNNPIERNISKIEIVDGSEVLWSLPADVAYALYAQQAGNPANEYYTGATGDSPQVCIPISFGRYLYDPDLAFVPRSFKNPQLKVTFNEATVHAAGDTGFVSDSFTLSITARLMEEAGAPSGWLQAKDIYDFTTAASGDEKVVMPTDYPWRQLFVRNYESTIWMGTDISSYKLSCDRGKFVPFDSTVGYLLNRMGEVYPMTSKTGYEVVDNGATVQTWMGNAQDYLIRAHQVGQIAGGNSTTGSRFGVRLMLHDGTAVTGSPIHFTVYGWCPHNTLFIPFGRLDKTEEYFQAPQYGSVDLYLTQGGADGEVNVCVEQLRPY